VRRRIHVRRRRRRIHVRRHASTTGSVRCKQPKLI
jgi:hypothetical protein